MTLPAATRLFGAALCALLSVSRPEAVVDQAPAAFLEARLDATATYLDDFDRRFSAVLSDEEYEQVLRTVKTVDAIRRLRSEVIMLNLGGGDWLTFRDVVEVDGRPIPNRGERLKDLFLAPAADTLERAARIYDEGARFNIGPVRRTMNVPAMALAYVRRANQPRSVFRDEGTAVIDRVTAAVIRFRERESPRLILTDDEAPAEGRFWLDPASGRVLRTELSIDSRGQSGKIVVQYAPQQDLDGLWVPVRMDEQYAADGAKTITGVATYSRFRRFAVNVATIVR